MLFDHDFKNFLETQKKKGAKIISPKSRIDEDKFYSPQKIERGNSEVIEGNGKLEAVKIEINQSKSGFSYFLDGIERKKVFIINNIPVTYGYVSAVILERKDKKLHDINAFFENRSVYLPYKETTEEPDHYLDKIDIKNEKYDINPVNIGVFDKENRIIHDFRTNLSILPTAKFKHKEEILKKSLLEYGLKIITTIGYLSTED